MCNIWYMTLSYKRPRVEAEYDIYMCSNEWCTFNVKVKASSRTIWIFHESQVVTHNDLFSDFVRWATERDLMATQKKKEIKELSHYSSDTKKHVQEITKQEKFWHDYATSIGFVVILYKRFRQQFVKIVKRKTIQTNNK